MKLTREQQDMLDGKYGRGTAYACILRRRVAAGALRVATRRYEWPALIRLLYVQS